MICKHTNFKAVCFSHWIEQAYKYLCHQRWLDLVWHTFWFINKFWALENASTNPLDHLSQNMLNNDLAKKSLSSVFWFCPNSASPSLFVGLIIFRIAEGDIEEVYVENIVWLSWDNWASLKQVALLCTRDFFTLTRPASLVFTQNCGLLFYQGHSCWLIVGVWNLWIWESCFKTI